MAITNMAITKLIWIALPNGLGDNGQTLRMSVYLAPSLVADAGTKVAQFPLFNSWPSTAAGILFQVSFDGGQSWSDPLSAVYDENDKLDAALWTAIFGGDVAVGEHAPVTLDQGLESYDADTWYQTLHHIYIPDPSELLPSRGGNKLVPVAARLLPSADIVTQEQRAYGQFLNFHRPRSNAPLQPLADATNVPNSDALDFHTAVSALSRYPAAMRALGLVFDLELPLPTDLPLAGLAGIVRVRPVSNAFLPDWQIIYPTTVYSLDVAKDLFTLRTALNDNQHQLASGMLFSAGATLIPIDLDALGLAAHNAMNGASQAAQSTPTPRNAGISLTLPGLAKRLQDQIDSGNNVWSQISQNNDPSNHGDDVRPLFAEDLIRGYRVDVRTVEQNQWHSLCRRRVTFDFGSSQRHWDEDEGLIGLGFSQEGTDAPRFSPMQLRWHNWSLCVPRPGKSIGVDGGADDQNQVTQALLPFTAKIDPVPRSLPRLRFNKHYQFRLRTVDLAGNSLAFDAPIDDMFAMPQGTGEQYLRVDPLLAPVLLLRDAPGPGESVERLVIVSDFDAPAAKNCERLVAMPKAPVQTAEWHGMFDTPSGVNGDATTRSIVVKNSGKFNDAPYGNNPPALPYLPDALAGGAAFIAVVRGLTTAILAPPQPYVNWPDYDPFRLLLVESENTLGPLWDEQSRTVRIELPKATVVSVDLSTYPANLDPLEAWDFAESEPIQFPGGHGNGGHNGKPFLITPKWTARQLERFRELLASGQNLVISPRRTLTFVHAVARPLVAPDLALIAARAEGTTWTEFAFGGSSIPVDGKSTAKVELLAQWEEPVDDGVNPPTRVTKTQHVAAFQPDTNATSWDLRFPPIRHQFGDTKYRQVTYSAVSTTRFLEYLDPAIRDLPQKTTRVSKDRPIDVPASALPLPPKLLYVVPTFGHQDQNGSRLRTSGIRVYLDRPWYSSGDGELLAVLLKAAPAFGVTQQPETDSVWGVDPRYASNGTPTPQFLTPANFKNVQFQRHETIPLDKNQVAAKMVVGFDVKFLPPDPSHPTRPADPNRDPHNGRWYADLEIDAGSSYFPMLRLALARIQPNTVSHISPAVIANIVPLPPNRLATVTREAGEPFQVSVTVAGPTYTISTAARVVVTLQVQPAGAALWVSLGEVTLESQTNQADGVQSGVVRLPGVFGSPPMRLLIREYELHPTDSGTGERLIYAELIPL